ncbi:MAG: T9SS type A sorting domain-containing protein [Dysgonamonadaceae bacterium]|nr:T9SS type A sorting domain-containing protein [Dysgonamonadaceae bacterium]
MNFDKFTVRETGTGLEQVKKASAHVTPNPADDGLFYVHNVENTALAMVSDVSGKIVLGKTLSVQDNMLDLSQQSQGMYFLKLQSNDKIYTNKLIYQ